MKSINYATGDATLPQSDQPTIICHSCNNLGAWGAGFVVALGARYPITREKYLEWYQALWKDVPFKLGEVQFVEINPQLWVANLIGQDGVGFKRGKPVRYEALHQGFVTIARFAQQRGAEVVMPRIGCGLGGGDWNVVEGLITRTLLMNGVEVYVVDLPQETTEDAEPVFGW